MIEFIDNLPDEILKKGIRVNIGFPVYIFYAEDMLEILNLLKKNNLAVNCGSVFIKTDNGIYHYNQNDWYMDLGDYIGYNGYMEKSIQYVINYINSHLNIPNLMYCVLEMDKQMYEKNIKMKA